MTLKATFRKGYRHEEASLLAAKTALAAVLAGSIIITPAQAGIPVIDGGNLVQNVMTAIESVAQTLKQIEQYQTQLQQYENMLQNTIPRRPISGIRRSPRSTA